MVTATLPQTPEQRLQFKEAMQYRWSLWRRSEQWVDPSKPWSYWLYLAGRGAGKTRSGAEMVRWFAENHVYTRGHLVGPTAGDVRDTMVEGPAGILAHCPPSYYPTYEPSKRSLIWPDTDRGPGLKLLLFSADEPERLRGPQCQFLWADEPCAWRRPGAWDMAMFGCRLPPFPRIIITTTPKPTVLIRKILSLPDLVKTHGTTYDNRANLAESFYKSIVAQYEGTRMGRQELLAEILADNPGALWKRGWIDDSRVESHPHLSRIVVGVDPAASHTEESAETGIVVVGKAAKGDPPHFYDLDDCTVNKATPAKWGKAAVTAYKKWRADTIVAEKNNGGDMVMSTIHTVDPNVPVKLVWASKGKQARAEPVASLAEQGRSHHVGFFGDLEDQLCEWEPHPLEGPNPPSPDRLDAKVWAYTELMDDVVPFSIGRV